MSEDLEKGKDLTQSDSGNPVAASAEFEDHALRIARWMVRKMNIPSQEAEDLAQQGLLKYLQISPSKRAKIQDHQAYLCKIIRNEALDKFTDKKFELISLDQEPENERFATTDRNLDCQILLDEIYSQLEPEEQSLLELMLIGFTSREAAFKLGISDNAVRQRASRLKSKVKQRILTHKVKL